MDRLPIEQLIQGAPGQVPPMGGAPPMASPNPFAGAGGPQMPPMPGVPTPNPMQQAGLPPVQNFPNAIIPEMPTGDMALGEFVLPEVHKPKIPSWWREPKKPTVEEILLKAMSCNTHDLERNQTISDGLKVLRQQTAGAFKDDVRARMKGEKDPWLSTDILDEWNALWSMCSNIDETYHKPWYDHNLKIKSQLMEDAAYDLRRKSAKAWVRRGDMSLRVAESKVFTAYGLLAARITLDPYDAYYPLDYCLVDPTQLFPEYEGKRGISTIIRKYTADLRRIAFDFAPNEEIENKILARIDRESKAGEHNAPCDVQVIEYWDRKYRAVILEDGTVVLPVVAHEYYCVPYVITYGPGGEPQFTTPEYYTYEKDENGKMVLTSASGTKFSRFKSSPSIMNGLVRHFQDESLMALIVDEIRKAANPPVVWSRSTYASKNKNKIVIDGRRGGITQKIIGEEELESFPTNPNPGLLQTMLTFMGRDFQRNSLPASLFGQVAQSNVSGAAISSSAESGMTLVAPWIDGLENHCEMVFELSVTIIRNAGYISQYMNDAPGLYQVSAGKRGYHDAPMQHLTPEIIDEMGCDITCRMRKVTDGQLLPLVTAISQANSAGLMSRETGSDYLGLTDFAREQEKIRSERTMEAAVSDPDFIKTVTIPMEFQKAIAANQESPEVQAMIEVWLEEWQNRIATPAAQMQQAATQQAIQPQNPMGGAPQQGPPGVPQQNGVSQPGLGQGPGSVSGQQGGNTQQGPRPRMTPPMIE